MSHVKLGTTARRAAQGGPRRPPCRAHRGGGPLAGIAAILGLFAVSLAMGCTGSAADGALSKQAPTDIPLPDVPVPPADGPKLLVLSELSPVYERPAKNARVLGDLRAGALVPRSPEALSNVDCEAGWYAVRPKGFVCADDPQKLEAAAAAAIPALPNAARPLPYRYGKARTDGVPVYGWLPTEAEQRAAEPDLDEHLAKVNGADDALGAASNDVPLDERGVPSGPPVLLPGGDGVDATSRRMAATFFTFEEPSSLSPLLPPQGAVAKAVATLRKGSGIAITSSLVGPLSRRFGVTVDGRFVPTDRLTPELGSTWHGIDLEKVGLPVAFIHKFETHTWDLQKSGAVEGSEELERRSAVPLTGRFRTVDGDRYDEAEAGFWLRARDITRIVKRTKFPEEVQGEQKWLDVSLANQTITAYEGRKPIYATLISSGRDPVGDPADGSPSTKRGTFRVRRKAVTRNVDTREVWSDHDIREAPWVIEMDEGFAITGNYWSDPMGEAQGFHDVGLAPIDARRLWTWADPQVPEGWNSYADDGGPTTIIYVRR